MNRLKRVGCLCLFTVLLWLSTGIGLAQAVDSETFEVASRLYESGSFSEAEALFQQLVDDGFANGRLYHNLASTQHKQGDYGNAILNYRRALELTPRSRDTRANLSLARDRVVDQFNRSDVSLFETITQVSNWLTVTEIAVIGLLLWLSWGFVWLRYRHPKSERQRTAMQSALVGLTLLLLLFVLSGGYRMAQNRNRPAAVVVAEQVAVVDAPGGSEELFVLHSGAEVAVVDQRGQWVKLTLPGDALQGWVSAEMVGFVAISAE